MLHLGVERIGCASYYRRCISGKDLLRVLDLQFWCQVSTLQAEYGLMYQAWCTGTQFFYAAVVLKFGLDSKVEPARGGFLEVWILQDLLRHFRESMGR